MCCQPCNRTGLSASETDRRRRYLIRMQPRWTYARSAARPNPRLTHRGWKTRKYLLLSKKLSLKLESLPAEVRVWQPVFGVTGVVVGGTVLHSTLSLCRCMLDRT